MECPRPGGKGAGGESNWSFAVSSGQTGDFSATVDSQLTQLRGLLVREHERLLRERELRLQMEVAKLRREVEVLRGGGTGAVQPAGSPRDSSADGSTVLPVVPPPHGVHCLDNEAAAEEADAVAPPTFRASGVHSMPAPESSANVKRPSTGELNCARGDISGPGEINEASRAYNKSTSSLRETPASTKDAHVQEILAAAQRLSVEESMYGTRKKRKSERLGPLTDQERIELYVNPVMCCVILVNAIIIGVSTDIEPSWLGWLIMDAIFITLYLLELALKLYYLGCRVYFTGPSQWWNIFDFVIILLAVVDISVSAEIFRQGSDTKTPSFVFVRLVRLTRFGRILRLFQFKIFKELLTMLNGLVSAMRALVWAFILLLLPIYALGLLLTSLLGQSDTATDADVEAFGTLGLSMFFVFRCTIGDCSLSNGTPAMPHLIKNHGAIYGFIYVLTIMLVTFGIFNLIMATFVDIALASARRNEIMRMQQRLSDTKRQTEKTSALVHKLWLCHNECSNEDLPPGERQVVFDFNAAIYTKISKEVFDKTIIDPEVQELLEDLDVPEDDRRGLFDVLDADGGGTLQLDELIGGIICLRGDPRRSDVVHVGLVVRSVQDQLTRFIEASNRQMQELRGTLQWVVPEEGGRKEQTQEPDRFQVRSWPI